eukprot:scaffold6137_cov35-Phaeocystis_antarctica.AAC.2
MCALRRQSMISEPPLLISTLQLRKTSPSWSPAVWSSTHGIRKPSICMLCGPTHFGQTHGVQPYHVPMSGPAGGSPVRDAETDPEPLKRERPCTPAPYSPARDCKRNQDNQD